MYSCIFNPQNIDCKMPLGGTAVDTPVVFTVRLGRGYSVSKATLKVRKDTGGRHFEIEMDYEGIQDLRDVFSCSFDTAEQGLYWYNFEMVSPQGTLYVCPSDNGNGIISNSPENKWQLTVYERGYSTPDWIKGGIIYQIFPDRFCREGAFPKDLPYGRALREDWGGMPEYLPNAEGKVLNNDYFGGNLRGIISKLGYLKELGVTAIYLNPIFEAHTSHRYDTADYEKIDPMLGGEQDFKDLCTEAARMGMGIILDGVFNHTGDDSVYFNKYGRYPGIGAFQSRESVYSDWYVFTDWPHEYNCWWNFSTLPTVNKNNQAYADYIAGQGGILERWLDAGASGWRLDVADELSSAFLQRIRSAIKKKKPEALLIGEVWEDASNKVSYGERRQYLEGTELDSVMNYPFRSEIIAYLLGGDAYKLNEAVMSIIDHYPRQSLDAMMNILGTHDTARILTVLAGLNADGKNRSWKAAQSLDEGQRKKGITLLKLASAILYFLPGVPCIYYGDEAGLEGFEDPFNRKCFSWGSEDLELTEWYRSLGRIRKACPALAKGRYQVIHAEDRLFVFMREEMSSGVICAVNAGNEPAVIALPQCYGFSPIDVASSSPPVSSDSSFASSLNSYGSSKSKLKKEIVIPPYGCRILGSGGWIGRI